MIYDNSKQRMLEIQDFTSPASAPFRMAEVDSVAGGRPIITFYGETKASSKKYKYLAGYTPAAGDHVLLARVGNTYVILGKTI